MEKKININKASKEDLQQISGIGNEMAEAIVRYRDVHGRFQSKEELNQIPGFSEIRSEKLKNSVEL
ncbi:MAG TPA: helix-hairpin-helix domain-containing protein [Chitinispirillaceae bacterium]|nr:helix-hairpin-helix domain-containing protein [Chitinispirillaceae bacterium]